MISQKFKEEYSKLNSKQKEAVDTIEGPLMVIAGPGTGKTTILTLRIANILLKTDTPPSGILALTFTEAGAKTMKQKLREIIGSRADEVAVHTFHGFAVSIIREFEDHFPHISRSKQMTDLDEETLLRQILRDKKYRGLRPLGEPDFYIGKIGSTISQCKQEAWTPEMIKVFALEEIERIKADTDSISTRGASKGNLKADALRRIQKCERTILFADVYTEYEETKKREKLLDFDDLIFELLQALREDKLLLQLLQEKFLYILVDEHQDTNDSQNLIIKLLADFFDNPNLFVVGDEKQAIYRFQGASVQNFLSFQKKWQAMKTIPLIQNYRSHQSILDASFEMIEQNYEADEYPELRQKLESKSAHLPAPLELFIAGNQKSEEYNLVTQLQTLKAGETAAVIVRRNREVAHILSILQTAGVDARAERSANIFEHPVGRLFFALADFILDPSHTESLAETFAGGLWQSDFQTQVSLIKKLKAGDLEQVEKLIPTLQTLREEQGTAGPLEYLYVLAKLSGLADLAAKDPLGAEVWRHIFTLGKELGEAEGVGSASALLQMLLDYKKSSEGKYIKINSGAHTAPVTVMTAHGSKGLEFDYVFLPFATEETWMGRSASTSFVLPREKNDDDEIKDARRLFYVALTRARKHAWLSYSLEDYSNKILTPLRFLEELDQTHLSQKTLAKKDELPVTFDFERYQLKQHNQKNDYAKEVLLQTGLSVTALNHFIKCPREFFYKSILKIPEPPNAVSEKGNAMHEAMANVWKNLTPNPSPRSRRGEEEREVVSSLGFPSPDQGEGGRSPGGVSAKEITKIITQSVNEYFEHSLLPKFEKEAVLEELLANAPVVATALLPHFNTQGRALTESWAEANFEHTVGKEKINLRLHGKLDVIIEEGANIRVFDYKTTQSKSVNEIKGETKNSDGGYFRQLIFYKILLENNPHYRDKKIEPALVFIKPDDKGRCPIVSLPITPEDEVKVQSEIIRLLDTVWGGLTLTETCPDKDCDYCN